MSYGEIVNTTGGLKAEQVCDIGPKVCAQKKKNAPRSTAAKVLKEEFPFSTPSVSGQSQSMAESLGQYKSHTAGDH